MREISEDRLIAEELEMLVSAASVEELHLIAVNAMASLIGAEQAVLWMAGGLGKPRVMAISGLSSVERNIDFTHWFESAAQVVGTQPDTDMVIEAVPEEFDNPRLQSERSIYLLEDALHAKLVTRDRELLGGLFVSRSGQFSQEEIARLARYVDSLTRLCERWRYRSTGALLKTALRPRQFVKWAILIAASAVLLIPVRMSATASAEITAREATPVSATQDGVIERILVRPNQAVRAGESLVRYDGAIVRNRLAVARQNIGVAQADLERATGKSFSDELARAELRTLRAKVAEKAAESRYLEELAHRLEIHAISTGVAIFTDAEEWVGRPVQSGERIMMLANPDKVWITLYLPPDEAIPLDAHPDVRVHLDIDPLSSQSATVVESSYEAVLTHEGNLAFQMRASLNPGEPVPRIGLKGVARVYGGYRPLCYVILRKPIRAMRRLIGW